MCDQWALYLKMGADKIDLEWIKLIITNIYRSVVEAEKKIPLTLIAIWP